MGTKAADSGVSRTEVLAGLRSSPKELPSKYFYDDAGSRLFEEITRLDEYYVTRVEMQILRRHAGEIAASLGPDVRLIEPGAGSGLKIRLLLDRLERPAGYVPIDVSESALAAAVRTLSRLYPGLEILPVRADFSGPIELPGSRARREVVFFPGSTIGNLHPPQAARFLRRLGALAGPAGAVLVGVDLKKDRAVLERAYDDARGVTAEFNRNLLRRLNRELGADFRPEAFRHRAVYDETRGRVEMHLVSERRQEVRIGEEVVVFEADESVRTECSYKYAPAEFAALLRRAGLRTTALFTDDRRRFALFLCVPRPRSYVPRPRSRRVPGRVDRSPLPGARTGGRVRPRT